MHKWLFLFFKMIKFYTPFSFIIFSVYVVQLFFLVSIAEFILYWFVIEITNLVFIGVSYSLFKNNFTQLLIFFIIQVISAFCLFVFYILNYPVFFTFSISLKLGMFPFYFWFINLVYFYPNTIFLFILTLFKVPRFIIIHIFSSMLFLDLIVYLSLLTLLVGGCIIVISNDIRLILLSSSVANNSWFFFSLQAGVFLFFIFLLVYRVFLWLILHSNYNSLSFSFLHRGSISLKLLLVFSLVVLSGLPPFPIFFLKFFVVLCLMEKFLSLHFLVFALIFNILIVLGYLKSCFYFISSVYSNKLVYFTFLWSVSLKKNISLQNLSCWFS